MERDLPELEGIVIIMSRATRAINVKQYNIFVLLQYNGTERYQGQNVATPSSTFVTFVLYGQIHKYVYSFLVKFYTACVLATLLHAIVHWLSFRRMSSYKKVIFLGKIPSFAQLPCLLNSLLINFVPFPSLPPFNWRCCCCISKVWFTSPMWLSVWSRSDFPKLCVFALFQLRLGLALIFANG